MPTEREKLLTKQVLSQSVRDAAGSLAGAGRTLGMFLERTAAQSIPSSGSVFTMVQWDTETSSPLGWFDPASNTRATPSQGGWFTAYFSMVWNNTTTGGRQMTLYKNGTLIFTSVVTAGSADADGLGSFAVPVILSAGDYLEVGARQSTGVSLNFGGRYPTLHKPYFALVKS